MRAYQITGGVPLNGEIPIDGAKNAVLPIMAASVACGGTAVLHRCPRISDVENTIRILEYLGCRAERNGQTMCLNTYSADRSDIPGSMMQRLRAAILFLGALLARFGEAEVSHPGGCRLGDRPIDLHLMGLRHMGYVCEYRGEHLFCRAEALRGCTIALPFPSVGATENLILGALRCPEEVVVCNAAKEPEIVDMVHFLRKCGAQIAGEGTGVVRIRGGKRLHSAEHTVIPDRIEAATYLCAAAASGGRVLLRSVCPSHLAAVTAALQESGCRITHGADELTILAPHRLQAVAPVRTAPYDGFPTDAQAPMMAAMAGARGTTVFEENLFSDRFRHVAELQRMGAHIHAAGRFAVVEGVEKLRGANVMATDLRGGAAMLVAALSAHGTSKLTNLAHIERGYASLLEKLRACGACIENTE